MADAGDAVEVFWVALQRAVDGIECEIEEKRLIGVRLDESDGFAREGIGQVFLFRRRCQIPPDGPLEWNHRTRVVGNRRVGRRNEAVGPFEETKKLVEAAFGRTEAR